MGLGYNSDKTVILAADIFILTLYKLVSSRSYLLKNQSILCKNLYIFGPYIFATFHKDTIHYTGYEKYYAYCDTCIKGCILWSDYLRVKELELNNQQFYSG